MLMYRMVKCVGPGVEITKTQPNEENNSHPKTIRVFYFEKYDSSFSR